MKTKSLKIVLLLTILLVCSSACKSDTLRTEEPPAISEGRSRNLGDYLVATDALGRTLPSYEEVGAPKKDRYVGLFYWLWHGDLRDYRSSDFDVTIELRKDPSRTQWQYMDYYWAEPELGYYRSMDEFVMRKHLSLFSLVGIDFLYLDFTNAIFDTAELKLLLRVMKEMQEKGYKTPKIVPFFNHDPQPKIEEYYNTFYMNPEYRNCMFIYEGKPLVLSPKKHATNTNINKVFTWREMWADFPDTEKGKWRFFDKVPMRPAYNSGKLEQIVVCPSFGGPNWNNTTYGSKSSTTTKKPVYDQYWLTEDTGKGIFFEEQWKEAHRIGAPILCITGWNEWKAGAWHCDEGLANAGFQFQERKLSVGESYFVDEFNEEFNRDLEPQKGSFTDNYFYQMAINIRKYKGIDPMPESSGPTTIHIDGRFDEWEDVRPVFEDFEGENINRNMKSTLSHITYTNNTARNDIVETRVTYDDDNIYFYVKTSKPITTWNGNNWMMLYIDSDKNSKTGWMGFDFLINKDIKSANESTVYEYKNNEWTKKGDINYSYSGCQMEIAIPKEMLDQTQKPQLYFHWVDNIQKLDDISEFFVNGESAPERRFNYYYKAK